MITESPVYADGTPVMVGDTCIGNEKAGAYTYTRNGVEGKVTEIRDLAFDDSIKVQVSGHNSYWVKPDRFDLVKRGE